MLFVYKCSQEYDAVTKYVNLHYIEQRKTMEKQFIKK